MLENSPPRPAPADLPGEALQRTLAAVCCGAIAALLWAQLIARRQSQGETGGTCQQPQRYGPKDRPRLSLRLTDRNRLRQARLGFDKCWQMWLRRGSALAPVVLFQPNRVRFLARLSVQGLLQASNVGRGCHGSSTNLASMVVRRGWQPFPLQAGREGRSIGWGRRLRESADLMVLL